MSDKIRVAVLFGGQSGEHEVSLVSARAVMDALDPDKYEVVPIGITKDGRWLAKVPQLLALPRLAQGRPDGAELVARFVAGVVGFGGDPQQT